MTSHLGAVWTKHGSGHCPMQNNPNSDRTELQRRVSGVRMDKALWAEVALEEFPFDDGMPKAYTTYAL